MAEHGAHLSSSGIQNVDKPNIFEVLAQENLAATIRPALKHAVRVFAEKYPAQLGIFLRYFDELFLAFDSLVQLHYLAKWGSSFAENFYDLTRFSSEKPELTSLPKYLRYRSLACLVLIPYIKQKLDNLFEDLRYTYGDIKWQSVAQRKLTFFQRCARLFLLVYPYIHSSWEFSNLLCQFSYMLRSGKWHSLGMLFSGTQLRRSAPEMDIDHGVKNIISHDGSLSARILHLLKLCMNAAGSFLSTTLSIAVFFLQFLEWWYASDSSAASLTALPIPKPPQIVAENQDQDNTKCPICQQFRTNCTALSVSGYVFCYTCINQYIVRHGCCPVTGYPASHDHLVKIYEQDL